MFLTLEALIDGVVATLREDVLPDVATARARSRLWAVVDVLANLRDRIDERASYARAEADSAADALRSYAAAMASAGRTPDAQAVAAALEAVLARDLSPVEQAVALRELIVEALARSRDVPEARAALASHLTAQAIRDVLPLKPSLLEEISKG